MTTRYSLARDLSDFTPLPGGDVGGDTQVSESLAIRAVYTTNDPRAESPYLVVDTYAYVVAYNQDDGDNPIDVQMDDLENVFEFGVDLMETQTVCTSLEDPGGTETWADVVYPTPDLHALMFSSATVEEGESRLAKTLIDYSKRSDCTPETMEV